MQSIFPTQPYWQIQVESPDSVVDQVQMLLWAKGIVIAGHDSNGKLISAKAFVTDFYYDWEQVETIMMNEPLLADPQAVQKNRIASSRNMLVPESWKDRNEMDEWFNKLYYVEHDEDLATANHSDWQLKVIYPKKKTLKALTHQYFPERSTQFMICPKTWFQDLKGDKHYQVGILIFENTYCLTFVANGQIVHFAVLAEENVPAVLSFIGNYWEEEANLQNIELLIAGIHPQLSAIQQEFRTYVPQTKAGQDIAPKEFLETILQCAS